VVRIIEEDAADATVLARYAKVSIAFEVKSRFVVQPIENGLGGLLLGEEPVTPPYLKDYDAFEGEGPAAWRDHFEISRWGIFTAGEEGRLIGGAVIAWKTPDVEMLTPSCLMKCRCSGTRCFKSCREKAPHSAGIGRLFRVLRRAALAVRRSEWGCQSEGCRLYSR
jgi:hypothetical protein